MCWSFREPSPGENRYPLSTKLNCHVFRAEKQINTMKLKLKAPTSLAHNRHKIDCVIVLFEPETFFAFYFLEGIETIAVSAGPKIDWHVSVI